MSSPVSDLDDDALSLDRLAGEWRIWQLKRGHRFSADDLLTAWMAANAAPEARRLADIGAGIGSVGLMTLWRMHPDATLIALEAQEISHQLMRRTVATNGLQGRVTMRLGDLREPANLPETGFDLVTGSPPYIPLGKGVVSPVPQRAGARMELRGTIFDYAATAARVIGPNGVFVVCFAAADPRGEAAIEAAGLRLRARRDVVFRPGQAPLISLMVADHGSGPTDRQAHLHIRDDAGAWTDEYLSLREAMGTVVRR